MVPVVQVILGLDRELPAPRERRRRRRQADLTLAELADLLRVDLSTIRRWERGAIDPRGPALQLYAAVLEDAAEDKRGVRAH